METVNGIKAGGVDAGDVAGQGLASNKALPVRVEFTVPGLPTGKRRPRFARRGKFVTTYQPKEDAARENLIALAYRDAEPDAPPYAGAVRLAVTAEFFPPRSWSKKKRSAPGEKTSKPDLDNIVKSVKDGLNRVAWIDDAQVVEILAKKRWGDRDEITVAIERVVDENP